jgi:glycosyltransferase involved in cell wall biosynthesis
MATAVLDLELTNLPPEISGLDSYSRAFVLLRYKKKPVGKSVIPVINGRINMCEYREHFFSSVSGLLYTSWMHELLAYEESKIIDFILPKATVAVCTRDRPHDLKRCLDALMQLPDIGQEFLVIDNCPASDTTNQLVKNYSRVRYIREEKPGLNIARNRALIEASHEIVAFTDDDAVPDSNWLNALLKNFSHPLVQCVTGMTMPLELETEAQEAFEKYSPFSKGFKRVVHKGFNNPLSVGHIGAGANMALRKDVVLSVGGFDEALDAGTKTKSGGDHEFFVRLLLAGYYIVYEPEALSWHKHRRTWKETNDAIRGYGTGVYAYLTRTLLVEREIGVLKLSYSWFINYQLPDLFRSVFKRPGSKSFKLLLAELRGCIMGPWAYVVSNKKSKRTKNAI